MRSAGDVLLAAAALSLAACTTGTAGLVAEGKSRQVPVLIYDTSWNNPREFPTERIGDPIPKDAMHVALINTGDQRITKIWLHIAHCNPQGQTEYDNWMEFDGPFLPGQAYPDMRPVGDWAGSYLRLGTSIHLVILSVRVDSADGIAHEFHDDVGTVLTAGISNFCPKL